MDQKLLNLVHIPEGTEPEYILKTTEAVVLPVRERRFPKPLRIAVYAITTAIIVFSLIFGENLFAELSFMAKVLLIGLLITVITDRPNKEYTSSPIELWFYPDCLVTYRPNRRSSSGKSRREICRMDYADITKTIYLTKSQRIQIYGNGICIWYNCRKDGTLPEQPTKINNFTGGMNYLSTRLASEDIVAEIEAHSPLKISQEDR